MITRTSLGVLEMFSLTQTFSLLEKGLGVQFIFSIPQLELQKNVANSKDKECSHPLPLTREKKNVL